ncbi:hypothetical protein [Pseudomonas sp. M5]|uniref:hypothetical protein n=1 Tax=Pseudomonas sp. M5 TaxID=1620788 RepID=UPI00195DE8BD|nr:hypothetical protein [Pseudomonas sp. M5]MBM7395965.1 hypothetical protein [Pseudomonas sp. M5]
MAPALPVIAGKPAPTGLAPAVEIEYVSATEGGETAWMPFDQAGAVPFVGAGLPAMQALRCRAPALPVIAGKPAPTGLAPAVDIEYVSVTEGG